MIILLGEKKKKKKCSKVSSTQLSDVSSKYLRALVIDPIADQWGSRGYIADAGDGAIIVYSSGNARVSARVVIRAKPRNDTLPFSPLCVSVTCKFQDGGNGGN